MPARFEAARRGVSSASVRDRVTALCEALPQSKSSARGGHVAYRVCGRVFAYFLDDHHGDGIASVCVGSELGENEDRARLAPERFYLPADIGPRGWFETGLDRGRVPWPEVGALLERSDRLTAPSGCIAMLDGTQGASDNRARPPRAARSWG